MGEGRVFVGRYPAAVLKAALLCVMDDWSEDGDVVPPRIAMDCVAFQGYYVSATNGRLLLRMNVQEVPSGDMSALPRWEASLSAEPVLVQPDVLGWAVKLAQHPQCVSVQKQHGGGVLLSGPGDDGPAWELEAREVARQWPKTDGLICAAARGAAAVEPVVFYPEYLATVAQAFRVLWESDASGDGTVSVRLSDPVEPRFAGGGASYFSGRYWIAGYRVDAEALLMPVTRP